MRGTLLKVTFAYNFPLLTCNLNNGGSERWVFPLTAATCLSASEEALGRVKTLSKVFVTHAEAHFFSPDNKLSLFDGAPQARTSTMTKCAFGAEMSCKLTPYWIWNMQPRSLRWSLKRSRKANTFPACLCRWKMGRWWPLPSISSWHS